MGINGLLPVLKSIARPTHISKYKGSKAAIDGYSWLHKGAYCCSRELCEGTYTDKFVHYCLSRVELLRSHGVTPIVVLDGGRLPIKADEESGRQRNRQEARQRAAAHLQAGNTNAALECYQRAVDVTPSMAKQLIEALKEKGMEFLVAPYEADAQLAYLARRGDVSVVITEDSDLLAYGCPRVLYKLDRTGAGEELALEDLVLSKGMSFAGFTQDMFLDMCVLAGCDFLANLPGIGIKKAHQHIKKYKGFVKVCKTLRFSGTPVPQDYQLRFQRAVWAFRHQRVFCPATKTLVHLNPLPPGGIGAGDVEVPAAVPQGSEAQELPFLGSPMSDDVARAIAAGELDPMTKQPFDLHAIYGGCTRPPAHLAAHLGLQNEAGHAQGGGLMRSSSAPPRIGLSRRRSGAGSGGSRPSTSAQRGGIMRFLKKASNAGAGSSSAQQQQEEAQQQQQQQQEVQQQQLQQRRQQQVEQQAEQQMGFEGADQHDPNNCQLPDSMPRGAHGHVRRTAGVMGADAAEEQPTLPAAKRRRTCADALQPQEADAAVLDGVSTQLLALQGGLLLHEHSDGMVDVQQPGMLHTHVASHQQVAARLMCMGSSSGSSGLLGNSHTAGEQCDVPGLQGQHQRHLRHQHQQQQQQQGCGSRMPAWGHHHMEAPGRHRPIRYAGASYAAVQLDGEADMGPGDSLWGAAGLAAPPAAGSDAELDAALGGGLGGASLGGSLDAGLGASLGAGLTPSLDQDMDMGFGSLGAFQAGEGFGGGSLDGGLGGGGSASGGLEAGGLGWDGLAGEVLRGARGRLPGGESQQQLQAPAGMSGGGLSQQLQEALDRSSGGASSSQCGSGSSGLLSLSLTGLGEDGGAVQRRSGSVSVLASLSRGPMGQGWSDGPGSTWDPCDSLDADHGCMHDEEEVVSPVKPLPARRSSTFAGLQRRHAAVSNAPHQPPRSRFFFFQLQASGTGVGGQQQPQLLSRRALEGSAPGPLSDAEANADAAVGPTEASRLQQQPQLLGRRALEGAGGLSDGIDDGVGLAVEACSRHMRPQRLMGRRALEGCTSGPLPDADGATAAMDAAVAISNPAAAAAAAAAADYAELRGAAAAADAAGAGGGSMAVPLVRPLHAVLGAAGVARHCPADPCGTRRAGGQGANTAGPSSAGSDGSSEPEGTGADENAFHSIKHVKRYAKLAAAAVDKVARHAGMAAQPLQQQQVQHTACDPAQPLRQRQPGRAGDFATNAARAQFKPPSGGVRAGAGSVPREQPAAAQGLGSFERFACGRRAV